MEQQQTIEQRNDDLANKIALLLVESKARVDDIGYIFMKAKSMLAVGSIETVSS